MVFAGDHGIVAEGVTVIPPKGPLVIAQMVLGGQAWANIAVRAVGADAFVIDAGLKTPLALPKDNAGAEPGGSTNL